eukprot:1160808-Pelagomonas_calceolata.AAC.13
MLPMFDSCPYSSHKCVVLREYIAHCSHVMDVRVAPTNRWAVSVGGSDRSAVSQEPHVSMHAVPAPPCTIGCMLPAFSHVLSKPRAPAQVNALFLQAPICCQPLKSRPSATYA